MTFFLFRSYALALGVAACLGGVATAEPINEYKKSLVEYYGPFGFHPFLLPEGHKVGDVIDISTLAVLKPQEQCFPGLEVGVPVRADLPRIKLLENRAANFWVRLKSVFGVELSADDTREVHLNIEDATVTSVPLGTLQAHLSADCPELEAIFRNRLATVLDRRAVVVSGVLQGQINTVFSYAGEVEAETKLEDLSKLLELPVASLEVLAPEVAASLGLSERLNLSVGDGVSRPLAYRPATIFRPRLGATDELEFEAFDPDNPVHQERLLLLSSSWADQPHEAD